MAPNTKVINNSEPYSLSRLIKEGWVLRVPLYQRPYAWELKQVNQLVADLDKASREGIKSHHIGLLSVARTDRGHVLDLIDGQQRITTLLRLYQKAGGSLPKPLPLEFYGRTSDQCYLESPIMNSQEITQLKIKGFNILLESNFSENKIQLDKEYIFNHAAFFMAEVPTTYSARDKNLHFVRMNHRGKQLEKHEILKVRLQGILDDAQLGVNLLNVWNTVIRTLDGISADDSQDLKSLTEILTPQNPNNKLNNSATKQLDTEQLYFPIVNISEFLLLALARTKPELRQKDGFFDKDRLIETFDEIKKDEIPNFIKTLESQLDLLQKYFLFILKGENYRIGTPSITKEEEDKERTSQSTRPITFSSHDEKHLEAVQAFLHYSTLPHHWLIDAFDWLANQTQKQMPIKALDFIKELERIDDSNIANRKPTFDDPTRWIYGVVEHYWFYRLDYKLWKIYHLDKDLINSVNLFSQISADIKLKQFMDNFRFRRLGSVEHIYPRTDLSGNSVSKDPFAQPIDNFGNLALISTHLNSTLGNAIPEQKKAILIRQNELQSIKMLVYLWNDDQHRAAATTIMLSILSPS